MATQFFQLRPGDHFVLQGVSYMKTKEHGETFTGQLFNAVASTGEYRYVLATTKITPDDEYYLNRISEVDAPGNVVN